MRHLSQIGVQWTDDADLRRAFLAQVEKLRRRPMRKILMLRGIAYDASAKRLFPAEGRSAVRRLAAALALEDGSFDIRSNKAGPAVPGNVTLHGESIWVHLSIGLLGPGHEVCFRKVQDRRDPIGQRSYWASVRDLLAPEQLAARIRQDLRLPASATDAARP